MLARLPVYLNSRYHHEERIIIVTSLFQLFLVPLKPRSGNTIPQRLPRVKTKGQIIDKTNESIMSTPRDQSGTAGEPISTKNQVLQAGAAAAQVRYLIYLPRAF